LIAAIDRDDAPELARDAGESRGIGSIGLPITFDLKPTPKVLIDFTSAGGDARIGSRPAVTGKSRSHRHDGLAAAGSCGHRPGGGAYSYFAGDPT